jgi:hypothetical protein
VSQPKASQTYVVSPEVQSYPSYPHPYQLHQTDLTLRQQFVNIIHKFKTENNIVSNVKVNPHTVETSLLYLKLFNNFWIVIREIQNDVAMRSLGAH